MIESLPSARAALARKSLSWCDAFWDDRRALAWAPPGAGFGRVHLVPQSAWYAYGLLARGERVDRTRAARALEALLDLQYDEPGSAWHGSFARWAEAPHPPDDAVVWRDYDPNWRQFLGTTFLALLQDFEPQLDPRLVHRIDRALRLAVTGEPDERVAASYSNIALMKAFLEVEAGHRLGEPGWIRTGEALADEIADGFEALGAFEEYNSPTYYGIDLHALALFRDRSSSARLRTRGQALEAALWRDVARWYHAGLRNLCGPYSRSYGMDMTRYVALLGLQLHAAVGADAAPLPPFAPAVAHGHDLFLGPLAAVLGTRVPDEALPDLVRFRGPRRVEQVVASAPARRATGWLDEELMIGAERNASDRYAAWSQYVASSIHWRLPDGGVGWLTARASGAPDAIAEPGRLVLGGVGGGEIRFEIRAPGASAGDLGAADWRLPGLAVHLDAALPGPALSRRGELTSLVYRIPAGCDALTLRCRRPGLP